MKSVIRKLVIITCVITIFVLPTKCSNNYEKYEGYKIYDITFESEKQNTEFYENFKYLMDVIIPSRTIERPMRVLLSPLNELHILKYLTLNFIDFRIINENVAESIKQENKVKRIKRSTANSVINFESYQRFDVINNYLEYLQEQYPKRVKIVNIGKSYEGRDLNTILITKNGTEIQLQKPLMFIDAGIHAREWIAPALALYIIQQLVENSTYYEEELNSYDWLIWPLVNPDGYEYSQDYDRLWRKSRQPFDAGNSSNCVGSDINRNFDFHWSYSGVSNNPCADNYPGPKAFSEPEAIVLRDLLFRINNTCQMYLTLHSYGNYLLYPWGYEKLLPSSWPYLNAVASAGASVISKSTYTSYTVGGAANVLYPAAGASDDYAFGVANISVVLCMELPAGGSGFDPPTDKILPIVTESWSGIRAMALEAKLYPGRNVANLTCLNLLAILFSMFILFCF